MDSVGSHFHNVEHQYDIVQSSITDNEIVLLAKNLNTLKKELRQMI